MRSRTDRPVTLAKRREQAAAMMRLIGGDMPDWKVHQARNGLTKGELLALGLGPIAQDLDRTTPALTGGQIEVAGGGIRELPA